MKVVIGQQAQTWALDSTQRNLVSFPRLVSLEFSVLIGLYRWVSCFYVQGLGLFSDISTLAMRNVAKQDICIRQ